MSKEKAGELLGTRGDRDELFHKVVSAIVVDEFFHKNQSLSYVRMTFLAFTFKGLLS